MSAIATRTESKETASNRSGYRHGGQRDDSECGRTRAENPVHGLGGDDSDQDPADHLPDPRRRLQP
jgi:hypothetical protein